MKTLMQRCMIALMRQNFGVVVLEKRMKSYKRVTLEPSLSPNTRNKAQNINKKPFFLYEFPSPCVSIPHLHVLQNSLFETSRSPSRRSLIWSPMIQQWAPIWLHCDRGSAYLAWRSTCFHENKTFSSICLACVTFSGSWLLLFMFLSWPSNGYYCDSDWVKFLFNKLIVPIYCPVCTIPEEGKKFAWHSGVGVIEGRYFNFPREFNHQRYNFVVTVYFIILSIRGTCFMQKFITVIANLCHFRNSSPPEDT